MFFPFQVYVPFRVYARVMIAASSRTIASWRLYGFFWRLYSLYLEAVWLLLGGRMVCFVMSWGMQEPHSECRMSYVKMLEHVFAKQLMPEQWKPKIYKLIYNKDGVRIC